MTPKEALMAMYAELNDSQRWAEEFLLISNALVDKEKVSKLLELYKENASIWNSKIWKQIEALEEELK